MAAPIIQENIDCAIMLQCRGFTVCVTDIRGHKKETCRVHQREAGMVMVVMLVFIMMMVMVGMTAV